MPLLKASVGEKEVTSSGGILPANHKAHGRVARSEQGQSKDKADGQSLGNKTSARFDERGFYTPHSLDTWQLPKAARVDGRGVHEGSPLPEVPLAVNGCWGRGSCIFQSAATGKLPNAPVNNPIQTHAAIPIKLRGSQTTIKK